MKIISWLIGSKIKATIGGVVLVVILGIAATLVYKYKTAIKDAVRLEKERNILFIEKEEYKGYNATLEAKNDSLEKVIATDRKNHEVVVTQTQGIVQQQRLIIKNKDKYASELVKGLKCKVPQKIKKGFLRYEWELVVVDCDSLEKTLR